MRKNQLWVIGSLLLIVVLLAGTYFVGVKPQLDASAAADRDRSGVEAQNAALAADIAALQVQFEDLDEIEEELEELRWAVPESARIDDFLGELRALEVTYGVTLVTFSVADATPFVPNELLATSINPDVDLVNFVVIPVGIQVVGPPEAVIAFIEGLQSTTRLFLLSNLNVTYAADPPMTADIAGLLYVLLDPSAPRVEPADPADPAVTPEPTPSETPIATAEPTPGATPTVSPTPTG